MDHGVCQPGAVADKKESPFRGYRSPRRPIGRRGSLLRLFLTALGWVSLRVRGRVRTRIREGFEFNCLSFRNLGRHGLEIRRQYYCTACFSRVFRQNISPSFMSFIISRYSLIRAVSSM